MLSMDLSFRDPLTLQPVNVSDTEQLVHQLAKLAGNQHVVFLGSPFPSDAAFVTRLAQMFNTEKLAERLTFEAEVPAETIDEDACKRWRKLGLTRLQIPLPVGTDLTAFKAIIPLCQQYHLALNWQLVWPVTPVTPQMAAATYWFLRNSLGCANIVATPAFEAQAYHGPFAPVIKASGPLAQMAQMEEQIHQQAYSFLYQWLTNQLAPNVKTILEINPFANQQFYKQFLQQPFPWKITSLGLSQHNLDQQALTKMGKTFDAIVLFQALDCMADPQRTLLMLQKYARPTTQWIVLSYNIRTIPTLVRLLMNQWDNIASFNPLFRWLKFSSQKTLEKMFQLLCVDLTIHPIKGPIDEIYQKPYDQIRPLIEGQPSQDDFESHFNDQAYLASGMMSVQDDANEESGFITSGFLNSF